MPLPTAAELTDPNATNTQMKQRLGQLAENAASKEETQFKLNNIAEIIQNNRRYSKLTKFNINNFRNATGALTADNSSAYSDYIAVKAGDVINFNVYAKLNYPVVVWCDATKTTFKRIDSVASSSTASLAAGSVTIDADGFITVNTHSRTALDNYFYAFYDEKLFLRPETLNTPFGVQGYDQAQKLFKDIAENRTKVTYAFDDLVWSGGNGTDLNNDGAWQFRHTSFLKVKKGDVVEASLYRNSNGTGGFIQIFAENDRLTMLEQVIVRNIDPVTLLGTLTKEIQQDGWIAASTVHNLMDKSKIKITIYDKALYLPANRKTTEITVLGDSLSQAIQNTLYTLVDVDPWQFKVNKNGVGGENVFDTSFRSGAVQLWIKGGFTIPASISESVNIDARWLFNEKYALDANGNSVVDARNITSNAGGLFATIKGKRVKLEKSSNDAFNRAQWKVSFAESQAESMTVSEHQIVNAVTAGQKSGVGIMMMGTNGGIAEYGQSQNDRTFTRKQLDELIQLFQRNVRLFADQKVIVWGYHFVFNNTITDEYGSAITARKYFRSACQKAFGERFIDLFGYLVGKGLTDLQVKPNADEINFIQMHDGLTSGSSGNTFLPLWSGDGTHCRAIVSQAMTNQSIELMYRLGWIPEQPKILLNFISDLAISPILTSITVGTSTTATLSYTDPGNGSDLFEWESSNPSVAKVSNQSWLNNWNDSLRKSTTITAVSAGSVTIICKCRFGGATASFNVVVT